MMTTRTTKVITTITTDSVAVHDSLLYPVVYEFLVLPLSAYCYALPHICMPNAAQIRDQSIEPCASPDKSSRARLPAFALNRFR